MSEDKIKVPFQKASADKKAWAARLEKGNIAAPVHELIIPAREVARIDEMELHEEQSMWQLAMDRARDILQENAITAVAFLLNDGDPAGQTVGHVHIHVLGLSDDNVIENLPEEFERLMTEHIQGDVPVPIAEHGTRSTIETLAVVSRAARKEGCQGQTDCGFSVFTNPQITKDNIDEGVQLTVQTWSPDEPRKYGLTNLMRVLNGYTDRPYEWHERHKHRQFEPQHEG